MPGAVAPFFDQAQRRHLSDVESDWKTVGTRAAAVGQLREERDDGQDPAQPALRFSGSSRAKRLVWANSGHPSNQADPSAEEADLVRQPRPAQASRARTAGRRTSIHGLLDGVEAARRTDRRLLRPRVVDCRFDTAQLGFDHFDPKLARCTRTGRDHCVSGRAAETHGEFEIAQVRYRLSIEHSRGIERLPSAPGWRGPRRSRTEAVFDRRVEATRARGHVASSEQTA